MIHISFDASRANPAVDRMNQVDLVIFDCDGVLVDSEILACRCLAEALTAYRIPTSLDDVFDRFLGRSFAFVERHYEDVRGETMPEAFRQDLWKRQLAAFGSSLNTMPHIREVLDNLEQPYCLASSSDAERIRLTLAVTRLDAYFGDRIYTAAMVANGKPAPDLFLFAAGKMGAAPQHTLVVEDSVTGVTAGKAAGMTVWGFTGGSHHSMRDGKAALLAAGADRVFDSMTEFRV
jgi:HAD superfamily hydrolase (TIGR01509 family)